MTTITMLRKTAEAAEAAKKAAAIEWVKSAVLPALFADAELGNNAAHAVTIDVPATFYADGTLWYIGYELLHNHGLHCHFSDYADEVIIYW